MINDRKGYLDYMRLFAIFWVIYNHTNAFKLHIYDSGMSLAWYIHVGISVFCRAAVPVFWMISGALLLSKEESLYKIWRKRILRILISLVIITSLFMLKQFWTNRDEFDFILFLKTAYSSKVATYLWYLYAYIGFLMSLPLLRSMVQNMKNEYYIYFFTIAIIFILWRVIEYRLWQGKLYINEDLKMNSLIRDSILFPLLGFYAERMEIRNRTCVFLVLAAFVSVVFQVSMTSYNVSLNGNYGDWIFADFQVFNALCIYMGIKYLYLRANIMSGSKTEIIMTEIGACTFGVYLLHPLIYDTLIFHKIYSFLNNLEIERTVSETIYILIILLVSYLVTYLLRKIKYIRYIL